MNASFMKPALPTLEYTYTTDAQNLLQVSAGHSMGAENRRRKFCASVLYVYSSAWKVEGVFK
jgi:hypothetical protein